MMDIMLALILPFFIMIIITRITFSLIGACIVTWMLSIFVFSFHNESMFVIACALLSFIAGFYVARKRLTHNPGM